MVIKAVVHVSSGEFKNKQELFECGPFEPQRPALSVVNGVTNYDSDYDVVVVPRIPDPRTEKWNGNAIVAKSQAEIDAYDDAQKDIKANNIDIDAALQAVAQLDYEERQKLQVRAGQTLRTPAECKARVKAIYRSLL